MRARLVSVVVVAALVGGCGAGAAAVGAEPASRADPSLRAATWNQLRPDSGVEVAQGIASRWSARDALAVRLDVPIEFRSVDYTATVFNAGSPEGFTAFITTRYSTRVTTASSATIVASNGGPARFATPADHSVWQAAGRPSLGQAPASGQRRTIPAGQYTFLPQGTNLTYRQAVMLPANPASLSAVLVDHLRAYGAPRPATGL